MDYLNKVGFTSDKEIRRVVLEKIGTKPIDLRNLATSEMKPLEFIEKQIQKDFQIVKRCINDDQETEKLFQEMTKDEYMNGMSEGVVMDIMNVSTIKVAEGASVKGNHVLAYDIEKG
jgi:hypothetical protein